MSVSKDASGRRSVQVEVEVPGTPEEVWQAIATGPGVTSWFVPTEIEERAGGAIVSHFGPGMDSSATVTEWDPPHRFAAQGKGGPNFPALATEWIVEARSGGQCVVRVVHSLFSDTDDWDNQLTSVESGWPTFFRILKLVLTHFRGQPCTAIQLAEMADGPVSLALEGAANGHLEYAGESGKNSAALARLEQPSPALVSLVNTAMKGKFYVHLTIYLYGATASATAAEAETQWRAWLKEQVSRSTTAAG